MLEADWLDQQNKTKKALESAVLLVIAPLVKTAIRLITS